MEIELCGYKVLIDAEDYEKVIKYKWNIHKEKAKKNYFYFHHTYRDNNKKNSLLLHRMLLNLELHDGFVCDHINGNTLDNRKCNLRKCTVAENARNSKISKNNRTGLKGVSYKKKDNKYQGSIQVNKKYIYLGYFKTPQEAHSAYCEASLIYHKEFGRTE